MKILIVDNHTKNLKELEGLLSQHEVSICQKETLQTSLPETFDIVILSGGSGTYSVKNHPEYYQAEINFVRSTRTKVIGICLGCQIIAFAFGSSLKEMNQKEEGITLVHMSNGQDIEIYESHRFVIDVLSSEFEVLGRSSHGIEIIQHKTRPLSGVQFHPEMFVNETEGKNILFSLLGK